jgi:4-amino-4-deoxy-L-arabinose transferase-like glycosyltransferase
MTAATVAPERAARPVREGNRPRLWLVFLFLLALTMAVRLPAFFVDVFNSDETFLATQAQVIRAGGDLYEEAADHHPPLVPYIYAATFEAFDTSGLWSVRVMAMLASAITALLLFVEARRRHGSRAGWIASLLCVGAVVAFAPQDGQAANFEIFMLPAMTAGVLFARRGHAASAGVSIAVATLEKQTAAFTLLPVLYVLWNAGRRRSITAALAGFAVPIALVAVAMGPGELFHWTVLGNGSYIGIDTLTDYGIWAFVVMTFAWAMCNLPLLWKVPSAWRTRRDHALDGATDFDAWLWLASGVVSVMIGLRFFGHYYLQLVPPLCLLSAGALARASRRTVVMTLAAAGIFAVAFSAAGYFMRPYDSEPEYESVSSYLGANTASTDRIFVWGSVPEIYWASNRLPATRFLTTIGPLAGSYPGRPGDAATPELSNPELWKWLFDDLDERPPHYVVDTAPAGIRGTEYTPISRFPKLQAFLDDHYRRVDSIDGMTIYERR